MPERALGSTVEKVDAGSVRAVNWEYIARKDFLVRHLMELGFSREDAVSYFEDGYDLPEREIISRTISFPFIPNEKGLYSEGRFNTEQFPCLYGSEEPRTALCEKIHGFKKRLETFAERKVGIFSFTYSGRYVDCCGAEKEVMDALTQEDWKYGQEVGERANRMADGLLAPSVRASEGRNNANYRRSKLNSGKLEGCYVVSGAPGDSVDRIYAGIREIVPSAR